MATPPHRFATQRNAKQNMKSDVTNHYAHHLAHIQNAMSIAALRTLVIFLALSIYTLLSGDLITNAQGLVVYTMLLVGYLSAETRNLRTRDTYLFWINPIVLASLFSFVLAFGVSNALYFMPEDVVAVVGLEPIATPWMNQLMLLVVLGALAMWMGYDSWTGQELGRMLQSSRLLRQWMTTSTRVNRPIIYACIAISLGARLAMIKLGVYGYSSTYDQLIAGASYREYLSMAESLGKMALLGMAIQCFTSARSSLVDRQLLMLVLGYEVIFGFLSGFKSQVVVPFIIVGLVYYSQRLRIPWVVIPVIVVGLFAAYAVIEPFRAARHQDAGFDGTSLENISQTMISAGSEADDGGEGPDTALSILARLNLTYIASRGIEYAATRALPEGSPDFLGDIVLAPAHALIPRFLWDSKPLQNIGLWYTREVMEFGGVETSSTDMSPFTYLNFAGGPLAVILGFLSIGILQRGLFDGLRGFGGGGLIVLFGLLGTLVTISSTFNANYIAIIRLLPILVIVQYVLLRQPGQSCQEQQKPI